MKRAIAAVSRASVRTQSSPAKTAPRSDFRTFRTDRIESGKMLAEAIPQRAATLRRRWRERLSTECDAPAPLGTAMP